MRILSVIALASALFVVGAQPAHAIGHSTTITTVSGYNIGGDTRILVSTGSGLRCYFDTALGGGKELMSIVLAALLSKKTVGIDCTDTATSVLGESARRLNIVHLQ